MRVWVDRWPVLAQASWLDEDSTDSDADSTDSDADGTDSDADGTDSEEDLAEPIPPRGQAPQPTSF